MSRTGRTSLFTAVIAIGLLAPASDSLGQARPGGGAAGGASKGSRLTPPTRSKLAPAPAQERRDEQPTTGPQHPTRQGSGRSFFEDLRSERRFTTRGVDESSIITRADGSRVRIPDSIDVGAFIPSTVSSRSRTLELAQAIRENQGRGLSPEQREALVRKWEDPTVRADAINEARKSFTPEQGYIEFSNESGDTAFVRAGTPCEATVARTLLLSPRPRAPQSLRDLDRLADRGVEFELSEVELRAIKSFESELQEYDPCAPHVIMDRTQFGPGGDVIDRFLIPITVPWVETVLPANLPEPQEVWSTLLTDNHALAIEAFTEHLRVYSFDEAARRGMALAMLAGGNHLAAIDTLWLAYDSDPTLCSRPFDAAWVQGGSNQLREYTRRLVRHAHASGSGRDWFAVAVMMALEGRVQPAREMLSRATAAGASGDHIDALAKHLGGQPTLRAQP